MTSESTEYLLTETANTYMEQLLADSSPPSIAAMALVRESVNLEDGYSRNLYITLEDAFSRSVQPPENSYEAMFADSGYVNAQSMFIAGLEELNDSIEILLAGAAALDEQFPGFKLWAAAATQMVLLNRD
jgi:hypothetical protein